MSAFRSYFWQLIVALVLIIGVACSDNEDTTTSPEKESLVLATTTSTRDSGLLDELVPVFEEQSGYVVQTIAVGTGAALKMAREGNADVLLVHAPPAEQELMDDGFGKDRVLLMHNDFVVVGPADDPAGIRGMTSASEALAAIASAEATFVSRGDDSGTNKKELSLWESTLSMPNEDKPAWYLETGQGMGASLTVASQKLAYTMTDRATYLALADDLDLEILVEGDDVLLNIYHAITVNPEKWPETNYDAALAFTEFFASRETQSFIETFGIEKFGQPLFFPDAHLTDADLGLE